MESQSSKLINMCSVTVPQNMDVDEINKNVLVLQKIYKMTQQEVVCCFKVSYSYTKELIYKINMTIKDFNGKDTINISELKALDKDSLDFQFTGCNIFDKARQLLAKEKLILSTMESENIYLEIKYPSCKKKILFISRLLHCFGGSLKIRDKIYVDNECPICYTQKSIAIIILKCGHFICNMCIKKYIAHNIKNKGDIECPICRALLLSYQNILSNDNNNPDDVIKYIYKQIARNNKISTLFK